MAFKSKYNRWYEIVPNGSHHKDLEDMTTWCIKVAFDIEDKTEEELQSVIDEYEEKHIADKFLEALRDYEAWYDYHNGVIDIIEGVSLDSGKILRSIERDGDITVKPWVKDSDLFLFSYWEDSPSYGWYKVHAAEDVFKALNGEWSSLEKCEDPTGED